MNETIQQIQNHRSIRKFKNEEITQKQIDEIIQSAQSASTSSYYQAYSIIGITDPELKKALRDVSGQQYVENNGHLFVFCADLNRIYNSQPKEIQEEMVVNLENTEFFMMSTVDASLAAQNAALASEAMGLGICYLGSLRNNINKVNELLDLPKYVIPIFGMAIGVPDESPEKKPRLPIDTIYHENKYQLNQPGIEKFDQTTVEYYQSRSTNQKVERWSEQVGKKLRKPMRMDVTDFVKSKNLNVR
ncbi:oxygen-insensitive NADPH nitroreductase [Halalkalibacillus sediminis]|uniref:Oxygen-insensitive NADPH nitroreductase n=1 Tax=Halalkalibacillus sediminis TaxID=2018042 RepID=A0A2I0QVT1_9BACI|nr:oxygen-insensitive NADPH nitroreductase [Halalkalibacillus sediminis]PKR78445.1 oxygen-insensitive NADPH nitroreductase [Halalkalibacillus sediminis]